MAQQLDFLTFLKAVSCVVAGYALYKAYKNYKKTKTTTSLLMFILIIIFAVNLLAQIFDLERILNLFQLIHLNFFLAVLPILSYLVIEYLTEKKYEVEQEREKIKGTFKQYVNPYVVDKLIDTDGAHLKGTKKTITVLFADIRDFTPIAERIKAEETVELLDEYFKIVTKCVQKNGGMIDKFIGDSVMAIYNMPISQVDHADRAVKTGIDIVDAVKEWNKKLRYKISVGIGIHTGEAVVGSMGTDTYKEYTAIGDTVNTASRLQSEAKNEVIISETTKNSLRDKKIRCMSIGALSLKGKTEKINAYKVVL